MIFLSFRASVATISYILVLYARIRPPFLRLMIMQRDGIPDSFGCVFSMVWVRMGWIWVENCLFNL